MAIKKFDREFLKQVRPEIEAALKQLGEKYGLKITAGNASFSDVLTTFKIELAVVGQDGTAASHEAQAFIAHSPLLGLKKEDLGREFKYGSRTFKLVGYAPRKRKAPMIVEADGKKYGLPIEAVKACLGAVGPKRPDAEIIKDLQRVECDLSPENLTCDGELSQSAVARKGASLRAERARLVKELGREPTQKELFG